MASTRRRTRSGTANRRSPRALKASGANTQKVQNPTIHAASAANGPRREVGSLLRSLRQAAALSQEALARIAGCSKAYLSLVESGQRTLSHDMARAIEEALGVGDRALHRALEWQRTPPTFRAELERARLADHAMTAQLQAALHSGDPLKSLRGLIANEHDGEDHVAVAPLVMTSIPIINRIAAGSPREFTDLDYPRAIINDGIDHERIACPDVNDPDAFAARVVGDSMQPEYYEGDVVVFSPAAKLDADDQRGADCFVRFERDAETTFKRVYFEDGGSIIRLKPLNSAYSQRTLPREDVAGLYAAVYVLRKVGSNPRNG